MNSHFHTLKAVAAILGVTQRTVSRWIVEGRLKAHKSPHGYVVTARSVRRFLWQRRATPMRVVLRAEKLHLSDLAYVLQFSNAVTSALVRGVVILDLKTAEKISHLLGRPIEELFPELRKGAS